MATYTEVLNAFDSVFLAQDWTDLGIPAFPANFSEGHLPREFVRYEVIQGGKENGEFGNANYKNGLFIVSIYVEAERGPSRIAAVADVLDQLLNRKQINATQLGSSNLDTKGADKNDTTLFRADYSLSYNSF